MKKGLFSISFFLICFWSSGQYYVIPPSSGNPGNINQEDTEYPLGGGFASGWDTVLTGSKTNPTWSSVQTIPFGFDLNGDIETQFIVSSSGVLTFDITTSKSAPSHTNQSLPHTSIPNPSICVWGISGKGSNDFIVSKTFGTAPNRQFWLTFNNYSEPSTFVNHYTYFSIVLEETSNNIYIVDQRNFGATPSLTIGVQSSSLGYQITGSPSVSPLAADDPTRADNKYYTFVQGVQPQYDIHALDLELKESMLLSNAPFSMKMVIENMGTDTINTFDFNFTQNGLNEIDSSFTGLSIAPWSHDTLYFPNIWNPTSTGNYNIEAWIDQINGNTDLNNSNDTLYQMVKIVGQDHQRRPLLETFTSSTSPQSLYANNHVESILGNNNNALASLKYPISWPGNGDPYYTDECKVRRQNYGITSVNTVQLDGEWSNASLLLSQDAIDEQLATPSFVKVSSGYYVNNQTVNIDVTIDPLDNISGTDLSLFVAIFEKTTTQNAKNSGETEFYHVLKKMLPNANGSALSNLTQGVPQNFTMSYTFNGNYRLPSNSNNAIDHSIEHSVEDFNDLGVLVWVQNTITKEVLQSAYALSTIGIDEFSESIPVHVFPNPADDKIHIIVDQSIGNSEVKLLNLQGQVLKSMRHNFDDQKELILSLDEQASGLYMIEVRSKTSNGITRFIIQ